MHFRFVDSLPRLDPENLLDEARFVQRLARALVRRADLADDVAQDVFVAALQQRGDDPRHLRGWLATLTKRIAQRVRGSERRRASHEANAAPPVADERERHTSERLQLQRRLCDAVEALPEPYRTTVTMRFFDDLTPRAIALRLAVPSEVVRQRLHRGVAMLRERLDRDFGDRRAWCGALAAAGLGAAGSPWLLLTVLAMNKLALSAAAALAVGAFFLWPHDEPSLASDGAAVAEHGPVVAATANVAAAAGDAQRTTATPIAEVGAEPECTVVVVDDRGAPLADAAVHAWNGEQVEHERTTDAHGSCTFAASAEPCEVLVCADGHFPWRTRLASRRGEHRLQLPAGASIDGVLVVDGTPPRRPWSLSLDKVTAGDNLPKALAKRIEWRKLASVRTGDGGAFMFRGLPAEWTGAIDLPNALWLLPESGGTVDDHVSVAVRAGTSGLRIATTQLPTLFAKLVFDDDGSPIVEVDAMAVAWFEGDGTSPGFGTTSDRNGNVVLGLRAARQSEYLPWCDPAVRPPLERVQLDIRGAGIAGRHTIEFSREQVVSGDVLVVRLPRAATTHFLALDENGAPIAGARVQAAEISAPTGPDGRGTFAGTAADVRAVGAPLRKVAACAPRAIAAGTADDPVVFVVPRSGTVRVHVDGADGEPAPFVSVQMHSDDEPFFTGGLASWFAKEIGLPVSGGNATPRTMPDGTTRYRDCTNFVEIENGKATLWSLVPGRTNTLVVLDPMHRELARSVFTAPADGEALDVTIKVPGTVRELRGRVVDEAGAPVAKARIRCAPPTEESYGAHATTDANGAFVVRGIYADEPLRVSIDAPGFVLQRTDIPPVRADDEERTFRLERGLEVTVHIVDEDGAPVDTTPWLVDATQSRNAYEDVGPGVRRWRRMPATTVTFRCRIGGTEFTVRHDTRKPDAFLRVPKVARLVITAPGGWPQRTDDTWTSLIVRRLDRDEEPVSEPSPRSDPEELLLPGRYRAELVELTRGPDGTPPTSRIVLRTDELTLTAGTMTRAELH